MVDTPRKMVYPNVLSQDGSLLARWNAPAGTPGTLARWCAQTCTPAWGGTHQAQEADTNLF